jgi:hypothetical protein
MRTGFSPTGLIAILRAWERATTSLTRGVRL